MRRDAVAAWLAVALVLAAPAGAAGEPKRLSFHDAITLATSDAPAVTLAQLREREANARVTQSRGAFLPSITGSASQADRTYNFASQGVVFPVIPGFGSIGPLIGPFGNVDARLKVSQTLFDVSSWQKLRSSRYAVQGARADRAGSAEQAAQAAALAYLKAARAEATVGARDEDLRLANELESLAEAQLNAGTSPAIDLTRARTQVAQARGALLLATNQRDRARIDLARTLGLDPTTPIALSDTLDAGLGAADAPQDSAGAIQFAIDHRLELRSEEARLAKAKADRAASSSERLPRLDAIADWGESGMHWDDAIYTREYMLALSMPIFDGGRREGHISEQEALVRESEVRGKDLRDQVASEVQGALLDLASGQEQESVAAERVRLAHDEIAQARDRFTSGVAGNIEVINAQSSLVRARDADIDARFAVASARVSLARAAGIARSMH